MAKGRNQYHSYTPAEKIEALTKLALNGGNAQKTAKETGIPLTTIITWKNNHFNKYAGIEEKYLDEVLEEIWKDVKLLVDRDVVSDIIAQARKEGRLKDAIAAVSILIDKALLLSGVKASLSTIGGPIEPDANDIDSEEALQQLIKEEETKKKRRNKDRIVR